MKRLFLLLLVFLSYAYAIEIDEYKTDVYFANGILTEEKSIKEKFGLPYFNKNIGKVDYAYNRTDSFAIDVLESLPPFYHQKSLKKSSESFIFS